jgi:hypothetical protein
MRRDLYTWALAAACHAQLVACTPAPIPAEPANPAHPSRPVTPMDQTPTSADEMVGKLVRGAYGDFFNYAIRDDAVAAVWAEPNSLDRLQAIVRDHAAPMKARFLACEVLFEKHFTFMPEVGPAIVAEIYAYALVNNLTGMANSWGLLYAHDDAGPVGIRFVMIGDPAVPALLGLLEDPSRPLSYAGSEEATVGNAYGFRVKDFAAFYLGKIKRISVAFRDRPEDRDREISALARALRANQ